MAVRGQKINGLSISVILLFIEFILIYGDLSNTCTSKLTCGECIAEGPQCAWCSREDMSENDDPMCDHRENLEKQKCKSIVDPVFVPTITKDMPLSDKGAKEEEAVQVKPQEITIKLRPNTVQKFNVEFRQAVDYPVDLYYLMDLSNSMKDDKEKLAELGNKLAAEMGGITSNFRLGFGSFVDKTVAPYVSSHDEKLKEPCDGCAPPYGYRNNMPLSLETEKFAEEVRKAPISGNLDAPEGGFDAIMQAIVCKEEIGWRNKSRKLLVYSSDNSYHYAGDGKLGGIVRPNDEACHLDEKGSYTMSTELDYPSLSQINRQIREHKINIIFAVTKDQTDLYTQLSKKLTGSNTGTLDEDSANVVDLVRQQYEKIRSEVEMSDNVGDNNIRLGYKSRCLGSQLENTNVCKGLKVGTNVTFEVELAYAFCPADRSQWNKTFQIFPIGLHDHLTVHLEMICECDCEKPGNEEVNSMKCSNGNGTFECGICSCNKNRNGKFCECDASQTSEEKDSGCFNRDEIKECSGVGKCRCGQCMCHLRPNPEEKYSGKFCECNNFSCDKKDGKICSGINHGICDCGVCKCHKGWKGDDCSCRDSLEDCLNEDGKICSGRGDCFCGNCICNRTNDEEYFGTLCDDCATCPGKCDELKDCVECWLQNQRGSNKSCTSCDDKIVLYVDKIEVLEKEKLCAFEDKEECRYAFKYAFDEDKIPIVSIRMAKECPQPLPLVAIVSGVAGGVVATGLFLLMLWKILTTIHDRRELAKFEKEKLKAKWNQDDNPLYVGATSTFQNPAYRGE